MKHKVSLAVVGSIGIDTVETPAARRPDILGGSVSFACAASSFFTGTGMVGVVGTDFPAKFMGAFRRFAIDLDGLQKVEGKTFRWSGVYEKNMNVRRTLSTDLNVFASFAPVLPPHYARSPFVFLANIAPALQLHVLDQAKRPKFVAADTMDLWINTTPKDLRKVIARVDMLLLNDSEACHLTGRAHLLDAARRLMCMGPEYVVIKKGEHGSMLVSKKGIFLAPAYPVDSVADPTGAGDSFAGGLMGWLAKAGRVDEKTVRTAMLYGSVMGSFCVEAFSLDRFLRLKRPEVERRFKNLLGMTSVS
ncbi:MAG: sugar kinase [Lentisphaerae bacterium]|nr:sugar kinase [Lentisphaerota bacterium]